MFVVLGSLCLAISREALKEEIRLRINVTDVVSEYVALKPGGKSLKGCCPFHAEKTPSFTVSEEFQSWHCFGCGEHGDIFSFLMKIENLTFPEALERLAKRAGLEVEKYEGGQQISRKDTLAHLNSLAAAYYSGLLRRSTMAGEYLKSRGLADETVEQFRLGYSAPAWDGLVRHLTERRESLDAAAEAGLLIKKDQGGYYDRFRNRIVFPIVDVQERIIGFGGRAMGDDQPKYLNSPETPLFSKTRSLYGLNTARKSIAEGDRAIVVEGYMDVISVHQAGFTNCVATLGTALTPEHITILSRYTRKVILAYDADSAGMSAALKGAAMFDDADCDVRVVRFPGGDDPDSVLRAGRVAEFGAAIDNALPIVDYRLAVLMDRHDLTTPVGRTAMLKEAVRMLADLRTGMEREVYITQLARYHPNFQSGTTRAEEIIRNDIDQLARRHHGSNTAVGIVGSISGQVKAERAVLRVILRNEDGSVFLLESLGPEDFTTELTRAAANAVYEMFERKRGINLAELVESVETSLGAFLSEIAMRESSEPVNEIVLQDYVHRIKNSRVKQMRTSSVLSQHMSEGTINPESWARTGNAEEYEEFLKKSGRKPGEQT